MALLVAPPGICDHGDTTLGQARLVDAKRGEG